MSNGKSSFWSSELWTRSEAAYYFLIVLLAVLALWVGAKFLNEVKIFTRPSISAPTISVSGEGKVLARPDIGVVSLSVVAGSPDMSSAQDEASVRINKVTDFLASSGIEEKDVKTLSYNINTLYDYPKNRREFLGYEVRQTLEVKIRDLKKASAIIDGVTEFGAIEISDLRFRVDNDEALKREARAKAVADAKAEAFVLAKTLGVGLGDIVSFSEFGGPVPVYGFASGLGVGGDFEKSSAPSIPTGENEITSTVNISFELR